MIIVATEVSYVKPEKIQTLYFMAGERYDYVIDTRNKTVRDYFIRIKQMIPCHQELQGFAVLRYHEKGNEGERPVIEFNSRKVPSFAQEYPNGTVRSLI
jgi:FtsP/CotA-like multicopper oxidase with cupredoxin domain